MCHSAARCARVGGELGRRRRAAGRTGPAGARHVGEPPPRVGVGSWYSTSRAACSRTASPRSDLGRRPGRAGRPAARRRPAARSVAEPGRHQRGQRRRWRRQVVEDAAGRSRVRQHRDGPRRSPRRRRRACPRCRSIRCIRMSTGRVVVEQRVQPVAHGVLDRELPARSSAPTRRCRAPGRGARPAPVQRRLGRPQLLVGVGAPVSMTVPLGSTRTADSSVR